MAELEEKLNAILGDRDAMGQIMALARSLSGEGRQEEREEEPREGEQSPPPAQTGDLSDLLGQVDPQMLQLGLRLFREYQGKEDRNAALLSALRPFLREERRSRLDRALQIARVTHLIRAVLEAAGERGEEGRV